ncbi:MAG: class I SAM-dependent methyltransferase [Oscillospiraceae bacterium]
MNAHTYKKEWIAEEQATFSGWDFSHLDGRWNEKHLPWDYPSLVRKYLSPEHRLLDLGTGGGEFLLSLGHPMQNTCATEGWLPNYHLSCKRLAPLGATVVHANGREVPLPFDDAQFDVIHNRHGAYTAGEILRLLKPGGVFLTQQVGGENNQALGRALFSNYQAPFPGFCLESERTQFAALGFELLESGETVFPIHFYDVGALVYYAGHIPWEFPGFSVEHCFSALLELQQKVEQQGYFETYWHRFFMVLRKPV